MSKCRSAMHKCLFVCALHVFVYIQRYWNFLITAGGGLGKKSLQLLFVLSKVKASDLNTKDTL